MAESNGGVREVDAQIAEKVFGLRVMSVVKGVWQRGWSADASSVFTGTDAKDWGPLLPYSSEIAFALKVVEALQRLEPHPWGLTLMNWRRDDDTWYTVRFTSHPLGPNAVEDRAETAALAICLAALLAVASSPVDRNAPEK